MARESEYYRDILVDLFEKFDHRDNINAKEYAAYLGIGPELCRKLIQEGRLPGKYIANSGKYIVPVRSIAIFEANVAKVR